MDTSLLYPLRFNRIPTAKPWAGRALPNLYPALAADLPDGSGESAELADNEDFRTTILNGPLAGLSPGAALDQVGARSFLGYDPALPGFPLMIKLIDTARPLSIQVHPSDERSGGRLVRRGKTESWLVLHAEPDALMYQGKRPELSAERFWELARGDSALDALMPRRLRRGDFLDSPAGMVHAIGGGLVLLEVQQNNNTTWRIHDFAAPERDAGTHRPLHLNQARAAARLDAPPPSIAHALPEGGVKASDNRIMALRRGGPFECDSLLIVNQYTERLERPIMRILTCLEGTVNMGYVADGRECEIRVSAPETILLPAALPACTFLPCEPSWMIFTRPTPEA